MSNLQSFNPRARLKLATPQAAIIQNPQAFNDLGSQAIFSSTKEIPARQDFSNPTQVPLNDSNNTNMANFVEKTLEYQAQKISFDEYKAELLKWFPLLKNFSKIYMDINIIQTPTLKDSTKNSIENIPQSYSNMETSEFQMPASENFQLSENVNMPGHQPANTSKFKPLNGSGFQPLDISASKPSNYLENHYIKNPSFNQAHIPKRSNDSESDSESSDARRLPNFLLENHSRKIRSFWRLKSPHIPHIFTRKALCRGRYNKESILFETFDMSLKTIKLSGEKDELGRTNVWSE